MEDSTPSYNLPEIRDLYERLRNRGTVRQQKMKDVLAVREGRMKEVYRDLFPEGPYEDGIVANMIDVAARDLAEVLAPLPAFNCANGSMVKDSQREGAEKRTKIANAYVSTSKVQIQMFNAADWYLTYGYVVGMVEPDFDCMTPRIQFYNPLGVYYLKNRWGDTTAVYMSKMWNRDDLIQSYPAAAGHISGNYGSGQETIEVVRFHDKNHDILFLPSGKGFTLEVAENVVGKCMARVVERPGVSDDPRGQYDDVLAVQVAKARFALLTLEAATKAVQAPIALPMDVVELNIGADATLRSATPEKIGRISLDVPNEVFAQQAKMEEDLAKGSRYPGPRTGSIDGSVVTGRGVEALMSGFDTQIRTGQALFADAFTDLVSLAFELDEEVWGETKKKLRGDSDGVKYTVEYTPLKDIKGDYTVDVQYGLMAGLDPNRALVFGLQARGDKLISRDFLRRQMPFAINANEEDSKVDVEDLRDSLKQFIAGYAQALPMLAQQGQDPGPILYKLAGIIEGRTKGEPIEQLVLEAFEPPEQTPDPEVGEQPPGVEQPGMAADETGSPGAPPGGPVPGVDPSGRARGVAYGQAGMAPGGRPDIQNLLASMTQGGQPNLQASVQRRQAIA